MPAKKYLFGAIAALPLLLQPALAETAPSDAEPAAEIGTASPELSDPVVVIPAAPSTPPVPPVTGPSPNWLDTGDIAEADFPDIYRRIMNEVPAASDIDGWFEHARTLLAGGLFRESAAALEYVVTLTADNDLGREQREKLTDLAGALASMGVNSGAEIISDSPGMSGGYFARLAELRSRTAITGEEVRAVASGLARQSAPVIRQSIPILIEAARRSNDADAARALHVISLDTSGVQGTALGHFLGAEILRMEDLPEEAFLEYGKAAALRGEYAIRARLRIAELVLDQPGQKRAALQNLQTLIATGLDEWRGDRLTLLMLTRQAEVSERLGDAPSALRAMARILIEYPQEPQAELARTRGVRILAQVVDDLDKDIAKLAGTVRLLRELDPAMSGLAGWSQTRNMLAGKIAEAGLTQMARAEYEAVLAGYGAENPDNSRSATLEGLIGLFDVSDRPELANLIDSYAAEIRSRPTLLSAALKVAGPDELEKINGSGRETPYFTGDDHANLGRINFEAGNMFAAVNAWERHLEDGKALSNEMLSRYYHAKSVIQKGMGFDRQVSPNGKQDYLEQLLSSSLNEAPDLSLFDGETSARMISTAAALAERVRAETASDMDAKNKKTQD